MAPRLVCPGVMSPGRESPANPAPPTCLSVPQGGAPALSFPSPGGRVTPNSRLRSSVSLQLHELWHRVATKLVVPASPLTSCE